MQTNPAPTSIGLLAWDGAAVTPRDVRQYSHFGFVFEATAAIATDAVFRVQAAPPSAADDCVPGAFAAVPDVALCSGAVAETNSQITIPAGTPAGNICFGTTSCRPDAFIQLEAVSGDTGNLTAVLVQHGPKR